MKILGMFPATPPTVTRLYFRSSGLRQCSPPAELRSCVKVEVAVLGSSSLIVLMASVDIKQH